ncbi:MAG: cupin domain-containing protein [Chloroflexi bacterium]|nr:cupin domain-containing protein [Chloroflexota bacterium]
MPILKRTDTDRENLGPGVDRWTLVDGERGAKSLSVGDLTLAPEGKVRTHIHPTEEAMVILEGELDAILGDEVVKVTAGDTVLAPIGVKHGFVNRSSAPARLMAIFPTATIERTFVD